MTEFTRRGALSACLPFIGCFGDWFPEYPIDRGPGDEIETDVLQLGTRLSLDRGEYSLRLYESAEAIDGAFESADAEEWIAATDFDESVVVFVETRAPNTCYDEISISDVDVTSSYETGDGESRAITGSAAAVSVNDGVPPNETMDCGAAITHPGALVRVTGDDLPSTAAFTITNGWGESAELETTEDGGGPDEDPEAEFFQVGSELPRPEWADAVHEGERNGRVDVFESESAVEARFADVDGVSGIGDVDGLDEWVGETDFDDSRLVLIETVGHIDVCYDAVDVSDVRITDDPGGDWDGGTVIAGDAVATEGECSGAGLDGDSTAPAVLVRVTGADLPSEAAFTITDGYGDTGLEASTDDPPQIDDEVETDVFQIGDYLPRPTWAESDADRETQGFVTSLESEFDVRRLFYGSDYGAGDVDGLQKWLDETDLGDSRLFFVETAGYIDMCFDLEISNAAVTDDPDGHVDGERAIAGEAVTKDGNCVWPGGPDGPTAPAALVRVTGEDLPSEAAFTVTDGYGDTGTVTSTVRAPEEADIDDSEAEELGQDTFQIGQHLGRPTWAEADTGRDEQAFVTTLDSQFEVSRLFYGRDGGISDVDGLEEWLDDVDFEDSRLVFVEFVGDSDRCYGLDVSNIRLSADERGDPVIAGEVDASEEACTSPDSATLVEVRNEENGELPSSVVLRVSDRTGDTELVKNTVWRF